MYSIENTVNNIVITLYGTVGTQTYYGGHFIMSKNTKPLCYTPETNIVS